MRRKSTRNSGKQSPEKGKQSDNSVKKSRRTSKRRRKSTSESENSEEEQDVKRTSETEVSPPETHTKHALSDTENNENIIEKSNIQEETMEKQDKKIKLKRNRLSGTNDGNETNSEDKHSSRRSRRRGSPKVEERTHQEHDDDDKKGKGKSKGKTKSKIEKSQPPNESETHNESEISTNAQVTPQSPQIVNTNVVDVAENAEDNKSEIEQKEEGDRGDKHTKDKAVHDEHESSTNQIVDECTRKNEKNSDKTIIEIAEIPTSNSKQKTDSEVSGSKNFESVKKSDDTKPAEIAVNEPSDTNKIKNENTEQTEVIQNKTSGEIVKSDEDFAGFTKEQSKVKDHSCVEEPKVKDHSFVEEPKVKDHSFVEEPMDISIDISFTIKADDSSINITESEETIYDSQTKNSVSESSSYDDIKRSKTTEKPQGKTYTNRKITILRDSNSRPLIDRKKGWGSSTIGLNLFTPILIDTELVQNIYTNVQFLEESEVKLDLETKDRRKSITELKERKRIERSVSSNESEYKKYDSEEKEQEDNTNIIAMNRKISIVDDSASKLKPPPSPAKNPLSSVLFITNLVRPFTIKQLKELLERTGTIKENGFWTDRIKSKCYVQYENTEDAEATRNALHGVHWPIGNGKKLIIDYATEDDLENAKNPPLTPPIQDLLKMEKENQEPPKKLKEEEEERTREKNKEKRRHEHVREWDVGKVEVHRGRSRSRDKDKGEKRRHSRHSPSPFEDFISRKQKKADEQIPQKLMDDLFQKTKTTPSIYWQPLSPEEIATKQQQRLERMAEHKRRLEESTRNRADFGRGGPFRRRYD